MKHASIRAKALRLIKKHTASNGTMSFKLLPGGGWTFSWDEPQTREVRKTVSDHAR